MSAPVTLLSHIERSGSVTPHTSQKLDASITSIIPRCNWGFSPLPDSASFSSILTVADNQYLIAVGSNLCIYNSSEQMPARLIMPQPVDTCQVTYMSLSNDSTNLAVCYKLKKSFNKLMATLYIYDITSQYTSCPNKPRVVSFTYTLPPPTSTSSIAVGEEVSMIEQLQFTTASFSHDNVLLACATNLSFVGCLVYETFKMEILLKVGTTSLVSQISFNPKDSQKLCTIGDRNMLQLWRLASKNVHPAPIHGLSKTEKYTSLVWLDGEADNRIVAGSIDGFVIIVQGTEQLQQQPVYAFGAPGQNGSMPSSVVNLLNRGDYVVAVSEYNYFSLFEVKRFNGSGAQAATAVLLPLGIFKFTDVDLITGMQWSIRASSSSLQYSFNAVIASSSSLSIFDIKADTLGSKAGLETGAATTSAVSTIPRAKTDISAPLCIKYVKTDRPMSNFHHGAINSLSLASRNCTFVTASHFDESVRVRNFNIPNGPCQVISYFSEFKNQVPNFVDMHPSGLFVATACEDEAVEFVVSDTGIGSVRRIPVKVPLTLPNGTPLVNTQPVSIVRYSHSGHLLAVVTGKFARIFDMLKLKISPTELTGAPSVSMFLMDNTANITDLTFSKDDSRIFTTAADGFVYSWAVGDSVRSGEFNYRGVAATKIATNDDGLIVAIFESEPGVSLAVTRKTTRVAIHGPMSGKKGLVNSRSRTSSSAALVTSDTGAADSHTAALSTEISATTPNRFLITWQNNVSLATGDTVYLDSPVTAIALGTIDAPLKKPTCVLGLADGRVLISILPFPLRIISSEFVSTNSQMKFLDEPLCKVLQLHKDAITCVSISLTGLWIFTSGNDGSVYMLSTSTRAKDSMGDIPESLARENDYVVTEKEQLAILRARIADVETIVSETKRDSERTIAKLTESASEMKSELEKRLKNDVKKRDEIILRGREDLIKSSRDFNEQIRQIKAEHAREISELESLYEKKLSKESLYLEKMRQAYDEFVLHARMDMSDLKNEVEKEKLILEQKHNSNQKDAEKQKAAILLYVDFINKRNQEIINALEENQDQERFRLKDDVSEGMKAVEKSQREGRSEIATLTIQNGKLKHIISTKEDDLMRLQSDLGWANDRIKNLELAVHEAAVNMKKERELSERWEFKAGEALQQISELERIRKALTSQLHALRQELGPKEERLSQVSERLQEIDREYELSLNAISQKEKSLSQYGQNLVLLQKQVRDYRSLSGRRDQSLRRAAKLLEEFKLTLENAQFKSYKKTIPLEARGAVDDLDNTFATEHQKVAKRNSATGSKSGFEVVEIMARSPHMETALRRLSDFLGPYRKADAVVEDVEDDAILAAEERERQLQLLHKSIRGLQSNLENTSILAQTKVGTHLADNKILLEELNTLRQQVRSLSTENQRLTAKYDFSETLHRSTVGIQKRSNSDFGLQEYNLMKLQQDSLSDSSLQKNSLGSLTKSKSVDSNIIQLTGSKHDLQLSGSNSAEIMKSSTSVDAQRNAIELRDQILDQLMVKNNSDQRNRQSRSREAGSASRQTSADKKIAAIMKENEDAIRDGAATEILAAYQKQILTKSEANKSSESKSGSPKKVSIPLVPMKAVPLREDRNNKHVALPSLHSSQ